MSRIQATFNALGRELLDSEKQAVAAFRKKYAEAAEKHIDNIQVVELSPGITYKIFYARRPKAAPQFEVIVHEPPKGLSAPVFKGKRLGEWIIGMQTGKQKGPVKY